MTDLWPHFGYIEIATTLLFPFFGYMVYMIQSSVKNQFLILDQYVEGVRDNIAALAKKVDSLESRVEHLEKTVLNGQKGNHGFQGYN